MLGERHIHGMKRDVNPRHVSVLDSLRYRGDSPPFIPKRYPMSDFRNVETKTPGRSRALYLATIKWFCCR